MSLLAWFVLGALVVAALFTIASVIVEDIVNRAALAASLELAEMDDDWADPWNATPTFRDLCANNPAAVDALAAAEASRADWSEPSRWVR